MDIRTDAHGERYIPATAVVNSDVLAVGGERWTVIGWPRLETVTDENGNDSQMLRFDVDTPRGREVAWSPADVELRMASIWGIDHKAI